MVEFSGIFLASLLGSWHCVAMCGVFSALSSEGSTSLVTKSLYHFGRLTSYSALAIALHLFLIPVGDFLKQWNLSSITAGVAAGLVVLWLFASFRKWKTPKLPTTKMSRNLFDHALTLGPKSRSYLIGVSTGLLPCLWLYGFIALVAAQESWQTMSFLLFSFWLGTLPSLVAIQTLGQGLKLVPVNNRHVKVFAAVLIAGVSLYQIAGRAGLLEKKNDGNTASTCHHHLPSNFKPLAK